MSRSIDPENLSVEDREYLAQRENVNRLAPIVERVERIPPVNPGSASTQLAERNAKGPRDLAALGDLTGVEGPYPDDILSEDETDLAHDGEDRLTVPAAQEGRTDEYPVKVTLEEITPINMAETTVNPPLVVSTEDGDEPLESFEGAESVEESESASSQSEASDSYEDMTNEELRDAIRARNAKGSDLKVGGDKDDLVSRLREDDADRGSR